ncbi:MAG: hypothetical protein QOF67_280 [Mycobacterium sp.]|jgi:hypothetical protein|nr:hypothetical protein [Mycobacterium sp.]
MDSMGTQHPVTMTSLPPIQTSNGELQVPDLRQNASSGLVRYTGE